MPTIVVSGIEFYGYHGVSEAEREVGHRFVCDVEVECSAPATETDAIEDTIDYGAVAHLIVALGQGESYKTVERLASNMASRVLSGFPLAAAVTVDLRKQLPPVACVVAEAGVRVTVER